MISSQDFQTTAINTIRTLSMDAIQKANSGHPGAPMGLAPVAFTLWDKFIRHNPKNPDWPNRDRFVLSAGHASMLLYSILHIMGYEISLDDIKQFRQLHGKCAGHPEYGLAPGIETTTGPLGQGAATSVGLAMAEKWLAQKFNQSGHEIINYNIFAILGDGCMMEGITSEAASLAGHLGLDNLVWIYDNNHITIEGKTALAFGDDVAARFKSYHWNVQHVDDANDLEKLKLVLGNAVAENGTPALIIVDSHIAYGSPNKQDSHDAHGAPLGEDEIRATKINYGWDPDKKFYVPDAVLAYQEETIAKGAQLESDWDEKFNAYIADFPDLAAEFLKIQNNEITDEIISAIPGFPADSKGVAGRAANGKILNAVAEKMPWLLGGSADLAPSNKTWLANDKSFQPNDFSGRNFHFGIRENAMAAMANGLALSKLRPFAATFLVFSDYLRPSIRLSALMGLPVIYIFTHDSIGVGEDGPTHQPVEHVASLRAIPNLDVIRPADANELSAIWRYILSAKNRPVALILSRQNLPTFDRNQYKPAEGALKGGYILADSNGTPDVILMGSGSEVQLCIATHEQLKDRGIKSRVISMPCWELFDRQDAAYKNSVLPESVTARVAVEAGVTLGWHKYVGSNGIVLGVDRFGESAPIADVMKEFGFTVEHVLTETMKISKKTTDSH